MYSLSKIINVSVFNIDKYYIGLIDKLFVTQYRLPLLLTTKTKPRN